MAQVFPCEFCKISQNTFFRRTPLVATSEMCLIRSWVSFSSQILVPILFILLSQLLQIFSYSSCDQKQPSRGVLKKRCSETMQQIYRRIPMLCNFIEITVWHGCSPVNLLHISKTPFYRNTSGELLLCDIEVWSWSFKGFFSWGKLPLLNLLSDHFWQTVFITCFLIFFIHSL